jgi:hypothetical protein
MSRILITARTRISDHELCLGGIDLDRNRCVRLSTPQAQNFAHNAPFQVKSMWNMDVPRPHLVVPHIEDVNVRALTQSQERADFLKLFQEREPELPVWHGSPTLLFDGLLTSDTREDRARAGGQYAWRGNRVPSVSLGYWIPDRDLHARRSRRTSGRVGYDVYYVDRTGPSSTVKIVHSGFQQLLPTIAAGSILSLSLARWWAPKDDPDQRERCTLQMCDLLWSPTARE